MTSSPHGPYGLGYTRATMTEAKGSNMVTWSKSLKAVVGIASNRRSACYGEFVSKPCTHRPSHNGSEICTKYFIATHKHMYNVLFIRCVLHTILLQVL
jgi:hypothetical protein